MPGPLGFSSKLQQVNYPKTLAARIHYINEGHFQPPKESIFSII
jgi:hypothetical protein